MKSVTHQTTLHLCFQKKCCVDRLRPPSVDDYYVARASALENNVGLSRVVAGKREMIGYMEVNVSGEAWHTLGIAARDERLTIFFDGRELFVATDRRFPGPPRQSWLVDQSRQHD